MVETGVEGVVTGATEGLGGAGVDEGADDEAEAAPPPTAAKIASFVILLKASAASLLSTTIATVRPTATSAVPPGTKILAK